jgi:predicted ABC-type sugar transport system permease subunit
MVDSSARRSMSRSEGLSVRTVTIGVMLVIALFGWGFAATAYAHSLEQWDPTVARTGSNLPVSAGGAGLIMMLHAVLDLCKNSIVQIPSVFQVLRFTFSEWIALPISIAIVEGLAAAAGFKLASVEREMAKTSRRKR